MPRFWRISDRAISNGKPSSCAILAIFVMWASPVVAQQEPPADTFSHPEPDLVVQIPAGFKLIQDNRKYLSPDKKETPRWRRIWQGGSDGVIEIIVRVPESLWKTKTPKEIMGLTMSLADPTLKKVSERDYKLDGIPAYSMNSIYDRPDGTSQRLDWFFVKPYIVEVAYLSSKSSSWDDPASKAFFEAIHVLSKK